YISTIQRPPPISTLHPYTTLFRSLETPTITQQSTGNSFNIANNMFGIHFKFSKPSKSEMNKIKKYYKLFGYELNDQGSKLEKVRSEEHTSELQSRFDLVCRLLLEQ